MDRNTLPAASAPPVIGVAGGGRRLRLLRQLLESEGSRWRARALPARWDGGLCAVSLSQPDWEQVARCVAAGCEPVAVLGLDDPVGRSWREAELTPTVTYSENKDRADLVAKNLTVLPGGRLRFEVLAGESLSRVCLSRRVCSLYEALEVMACGLAAGVPAERSAAFLTDLSRPRRGLGLKPGRNCDKTV